MKHEGSPIMTAPSVTLSVISGADRNGRMTMDDDACPSALLHRQ
jgi:hypothetical protein